MTQLFKDVNIDWLGKRRFFIAISILLLLAGMGTALYRQAFHPNHTDAFNLGVDFKGGTVVTVRFKKAPPVEAIRSAIDKTGLKGAVIQEALSRPGEFLVHLPRQGEAEGPASDEQARATVKKALDTFGAEADPKLSLTEDAAAAYKIEG